MTATKFTKVLCADLVMKDLVEKYGELTLDESEDYFVDLARSIVAQQLSVKAASTIWKRVENLLDMEVTAEKFLSVPDELVRQAGVSGNKIKYIKNTAQAVLDKSLDLENIRTLSNDEILRQLTTIKGIGLWTAEMFLIFSLAREDIFSFGDGGLNSAVNMLYGSGAVLTKEEIGVITEKWKPYRSIASLYLWQSLDNAK
jgi:DNA-3-methyladenine glycosylase II